MENIVILGGGFAGLWAALTAAREVAHAKATAAIGITLVSRDLFLTVRPRLYEAFQEGLRAPLAPTLTPLNVQLVAAEVTAVALDAQRVSLRHADGREEALAYDRLILATGSEQIPLAVPGASEFGLNIDTFAGAEAFDAHLKRTIEAPDTPGRLTFVVVGGGFTGIELAAEMRRRIALHSNAEIARASRVLLIEQANIIGPDLGANPRPHIDAALLGAQVEVRLGTRVARIERSAVVLENGERIPAATVILTTGLRAQSLGASLGAPTDASGRVVVDANLRVTSHPAVFAAGDVAHAMADATHATLMSCQHAVPAGKHAGYNAARDLLGLPLRTYTQPQYVTVLDLGDYGAIFTQGWDRQIDQAGPEVKALKQMVNTQWIYPPTGSAEALLIAADIDAPWPPVV